MSDIDKKGWEKFFQLKAFRSFTWDEVWKLKENGKKISKHFTINPQIFFHFRIGSISFLIHKKKYLYFNP